MSLSFFILSLCLCVFHFFFLTVFLSFFYLSVCCILICWFMQKYTYIYWIHTDAMITDARIKDARRKTQEGGHRKTSLTIYFYLSLYCKGSKGLFNVCMWEGAETEHKLHILTPLLWPSHCVFLVLLMLGSTPSGLSEGPLGRVWLSLPHLVSNCLEFYWQLLWHPTQLNYIIIQLPHDRLLDLWNRMFNRHQAEITVMQFRGYSLPVHHCSGTMGPSPCPIS